MREPLMPLDRAPVSVHTLCVSYPGGQYRHEDPEQRRAALDGVPLGADDERILRWLAGWDVPTVATVVSLLRRTRNAATQHDGRCGSDPR